MRGSPQLLPPRPAFLGPSVSGVKPAPRSEMKTAEPVLCSVPAMLVRMKYRGGCELGSTDCVLSAIPPVAERHLHLHLNLERCLVKFMLIIRSGPLYESGQVGCGVSGHLVRPDSG